MSGNPGDGVRVVSAGPMALLCPECFALRENCGCDRYLLEGQEDASENGVYRITEIGPETPTTITALAEGEGRWVRPGAFEPKGPGNRHERRKRKAMARGQER